MITVALRSLGCKVNAYETEKIQQKLAENSYSIVPFDTVADIYIVNTCSVTNIADQKSRQMLHRAKKMNPDAIVVAMGCYAQTGGDRLQADPMVDLIIGNDQKNEIVRLLNEYIQSEGESVNSGKRTGNDSPEEVCGSGNGNDHSSDSRVRAFVKIEDGCNRFCSYCVIPYARGRVTSRSIREVSDEVRELVYEGYKEIVLTGIHICSFGTDRGEAELTALLEELDSIEGLIRIRLGSLEPAFITPEWIGRAKAIKKLCPHFHLSLQSGSDTVLKRMNRHYTTEEYSESVRLLREAFDDPAITTDIIVGFPGETEEEFEETCEFVQRTGFYEPHIFKYSRREKTKAAQMPGQVRDMVKAARSDKLITLGHESSDAYRERHIGKSVQLLTEEALDADDEVYMAGHTREYIYAAVPRRLISGEMPETSDTRNMIINGRIEGFISGDIPLIIPTPQG